jgi:hypothetical protein
MTATTSHTETVSMPSPSTDLRGVTFSYLSDRVARGRYLGIDILILRSNGYVNGNRIASMGRTKGRDGEEGKPKRFENWFSLRETKALIGSLSQEVLPTGIQVSRSLSREPLTMYVADLPRDQRGTYIHKDLVPALAAWTSPALASSISSIVNAFAVEQMAETQRQALAAVHPEARAILNKREAITAELNALVIRYSDELEELKRTYEARINLMKEEHATEMDHLREEHSLEIDNLQEEHEVIVSRLEAETKALASKTAHTKAEKKELASRYTTLDRDYEDLDAYREEAEERAVYEGTMRQRCQKEASMARSSASNIARECDELEAELDETQAIMRTFVLNVLSPEWETINTSVIRLIRRDECLPSPSSYFLLSSPFFIYRCVLPGNYVSYYAFTGAPSQVLISLLGLDEDYRSHCIPSSFLLGPHAWPSLMERMERDRLIRMTSFIKGSHDIFVLVPPFIEEALSSLITEETSSLHHP